MIFRLIRAIKIKSKEPVSKRHSNAKHINHFRRENFRVFNAGPYFNLDLWYEIKWHKEHIKNLIHHSKNPHKFHRQFTDGEISHERQRYFKEHVLDSIPFHKKILEENEKRLKTILSLMPKSTYKKIVKISMKYNGTPEYFVYDKITKEFFFVSEKSTPERKRWIHLVRDKYYLADVLELN